ncbi:MAG: hypothetical protein KY468_10780, partial [Armatimonadetes bacterium]|nr:hypothetical protein [Armatimonadota bacterium]
TPTSSHPTHHALYIAADHFILKVTPDGKISRFAGGGYPDWQNVGDGGPADQASLKEPKALAMDSLGNLFVADTGNSRIRRIDRNGVITTIAGWTPAGDTRGFAGDGGPAVKAQLHHPAGVAVAKDGSIYLSDTFNHRVRKVDPNGVITTVAGGGSVIGDGGPGNLAGLSTPSDLTLDDRGNLYVATEGYHRIRRLNTDGTITTVAGNGLGGFSGDGGFALQARLNAPPGIALDPAGNLYLADSGNNRVRKVIRADLVSAPPATQAAPGG